MLHEKAGFTEGFHRHPARAFRELDSSALSGPQIAYESLKLTKRRSRWEGFLRTYASLPSSAQVVTLVTRGNHLFLCRLCILTYWSSTKKRGYTNDTTEQENLSRVGGIWRYFSSIREPGGGMFLYFRPSFLWVCWLPRDTSPYTGVPRDSDISGSMARNPPVE